MYNSTIYPNTAANEYVVIAANEAFMSGQNYTYLPSSNMAYNSTVYERIGNELQAKVAAGKLQRLESQDCLDTYQSILISQFSNLVIVTPLNSTSALSPNTWSFMPTTLRDQARNRSIVDNSWICGQEENTCNITRIPQTDTDWQFAYCPGNPDECQNPPNTTVEYCLVESVNETCSVGLSMPILITVIFLNTAKMTALLFLVSRRRFRPLVTIGDALASFLDCEDIITRNMGPISASEVRERSVSLGLRQKERLGALQLIRHWRKDSYNPVTESERSEFLERATVDNWQWRRHWIEGAGRKVWNWAILM